MNTGFSGFNARPLSFLFIKNYVLQIDKADFFIDVPQTAQHLKLTANLKSTFSGVNANVARVEFNGDTGSNYNNLLALMRHSSSFTTQQAIAQAYGWIFSVPGTNSLDGRSVNECTITNYRERQYKSWVSPTFNPGDGSVGANGGAVYYFGGDWVSYQPIRVIHIYEGTSEKFVKGSQITIYGY